jgi:Fe-S cluster biogenesis protein NfuA
MYMDGLTGDAFKVNHQLIMTDNIEKQVLEVIHNLNWLLEAHESHVELIKIKGNQVTIRCVGHCNECETDCIGVAFEERMPEIILVRRNAHDK